MEIILKQDIENLGYKNDLLSVKDGYGRNYLIPKGLAVLATISEKKVREETLKQRAHKENKLIDEAQSIADKLKDSSVKIGAKVGEKGKIFGSINTIQLADVLKKDGFNIDRKNIAIKNEPIKTIGNYEAEVVLHKDVKTTINFEVVEE